MAPYPHRDESEEVTGPTAVQVIVVIITIIVVLACVIVFYLFGDDGPSTGDTRITYVDGWECVEQYQTTGGFFSDSQWKIVSCEGGGR